MIENLTFENFSEKIPKKPSKTFTIIKGENNLDSKKEKNNLIQKDVITNNLEKLKYEILNEIRPSKNDIVNNSFEELRKIAENIENFDNEESIKKQEEIISILKEQVDELRKLKLLNKRDYEKISKEIEKTNTLIKIQNTKIKKETKVEKIGKKLGFNLEGGIKKIFSKENRKQLITGILGLGLHGLGLSTGVLGFNLLGGKILDKRNEEIENIRRRKEESKNLRNEISSNLLKNKENEYIRKKYLSYQTQTKKFPFSSETNKNSQIRYNTQIKSLPIPQIQSTIPIQNQEEKSSIVKDVAVDAMGDFVANKISKGRFGSKIFGKIGKIGNFFGAGFFRKGILKSGLRLAGKLAVPLAIASSIWDFGKGILNPEEITGEKDASFGKRIGAGLSSLASGLTLGLIDSKTIYETGKKILNFKTSEDMNEIPSEEQKQKEISQEIKKQESIDKDNIKIQRQKEVYKNNIEKKSFIEDENIGIIPKDTGGIKTQFIDEEQRKIIEGDNTNLSAKERLKKQRVNQVLKMKEETAKSFETSPTIELEKENVKLEKEKQKEIKQIIINNQNNNTTSQTNSDLPKVISSSDNNIPVFLYKYLMR